MFDNMKNEIFFVGSGVESEDLKALFSFVEKVFHA